jgi:predicted AAA+ superfamily ATPase
MTPITAQEVPTGRDSRELLWLRGGFPDSLLAGSEDESIDFRAEIIRTYLLRDIAIFGPGVSASMIERLWLALAHRQGSVLNTSDLARSIDATTREVGRYIALLADLFMVRRLPPYAVNVGKRLVKSPKVYIRDSGILHALSRIEDLNGLVGHPVLGPSWEGFVIENLLSVLPFLYRGFFYRTHVGAQIDLVIEHPDLSTWAIEIKRSQGMRLDKGFHIARQDIQATRSFMVHGGDARFSLGDGFEALGLTDMMEELQAL